jgi:hypothetical protein
MASASGTSRSFRICAERTTESRAFVNYPPMNGQACGSLPRWLRGQATYGRLTAPQPGRIRTAMATTSTVRDSRSPLARVRGDLRRDPEKIAHLFTCATRVVNAGLALAANRLSLPCSAGDPFPPGRERLGFHGGFPLKTSVNRSDAWQQPANARVVSFPRFTGLKAEVGLPLHVRRHERLGGGICVPCFVRCPRS